MQHIVIHQRVDVIGDWIIGMGKVVSKIGPVMHLDLWRVKCQVGQSGRYIGVKLDSQIEWKFTVFQSGRT